MSKYATLTAHLQKLKPDSWTASFAELERIVGCKLPPSAKEYPAWWANQNRAQSTAWEGAGWRTSAVDLKRRAVTFRRVNAAKMTEATRKLSIAEAKAGLALNFNLPISSIEISIKG